MHAMTASLDHLQRLTVADGFVNGMALNTPVR
jgi:hypothetical protein